MITFTRLAAPLALFALVLTGCQEEKVVEKPAPVELTAEAVGHYCQMTVLEHNGPKAQIHFAGNPNPLWFTQVRDAIAFTRLPEERKDYVAVYVNDMGKAESWDQPGADNWIDADEAWFVIDSDRRGGMNAQEAIPFGARADADALVAKMGGRVVRLADVSDDYVFAPAEMTPPAGTDPAPAHARGEM